MLSITKTIRRVYYPNLPVYLVMWLSSGMDVKDKKLASDIIVGKAHSILKLAKEYEFIRGRLNCS